AWGEFKDGTYYLKSTSLGNDSLACFHGYVTGSLGFSYFENGKASGLAAYGEVVPALENRFRSCLNVSIEGIGFSRQRFSNTPVNLQKLRPQAYDRYKHMYTYPSDTNILRMSVGYLPHDIAATAEKVIRDVF